MKKIGLKTREGEGGGKKRVKIEEKRAGGDGTMNIKAGT